MKQNFWVRQVCMPSLKAWEQGSGAPAHRQVVQGPLGHSARKGLHPDVTDLIFVQVELLELWGLGPLDGVLAPHCLVPMP